MNAHPNASALRAIAIYKFVKASGLLILACAAFGLLHTEFLDAIADWVEHLPIQNGRNILQHWVDVLTGATPRRFVVVGVAACVYATLFSIEGFGLWAGKRWAEYLTIIATASLVPFEIYELVRFPTPTKAIVLIVNIAIVIYLWYLLKRGQQKATRQSKPS